MGSSKNSMDAIKLPDKEKINSLQGGYVGSRRVYKERGIDDFTGAVRARAEFAEAAPIKVPERTEPDEKDEDDFIPKPKPAPSPEAKKRSIRLGGRYIARWRFFKVAAIALAVLIVLCTFFPPILSSTQESDTIKTNIFVNKGLSAVKEDLLKEENVFNIENMKSEKPDNYRICSVSIQVSNYTPFKTYIDGFSIVTCDPLYEDKFVSVSIDSDDGYTIEPFKVKTVTAKILVCVAELNDEQLTDAVTSLVLRTTGMKKSLGGLPGVPTVPGIVFVSDALEFHLD